MKFDLFWTWGWHVWQRWYVDPAAWPIHKRATEISITLGLGPLTFSIWMPLLEALDDPA